jgi:hypothetical protein
MKTQYKVFLGILGLGALFMFYQNFTSSELNTLIEASGQEQKTMQKTWDKDLKKDLQRKPAAVRERVITNDSETIIVGDSGLKPADHPNFKKESERKAQERLQREFEKSR